MWNASSRKAQGVRLQSKKSAECVVFARKTFVNADRAIHNQLESAVASIFFKLPDVEVKQKDSFLSEKSFK